MHCQEEEEEEGEEEEGEEEEEDGRRRKEEEKRKRSRKRRRRGGRGGKRGRGGRGGGRGGGEEEWEGEEKKNSVGLTFAANTEVTSFTNNGLHKKKRQVKRYCTLWSLKFALKASNKAGFKGNAGNSSMERLIIYIHNTHLIPQE